MYIASAMPGSCGACHGPRIPDAGDPDNPWWHATGGARTGEGRRICGPFDVWHESTPHRFLHENGPVFIFGGCWQFNRRGAPTKMGTMFVVGQQHPPNIHTHRTQPLEPNHAPACHPTLTGSGPSHANLTVPDPARCCNVWQSCRTPALTACHWRLIHRARDKGTYC